MYVFQVVLPTFILERRSLLEMYADFFAHPDLFVRYLTEHCVSRLLRCYSVVSCFSGIDAFHFAFQTFLGKNGIEYFVSVRCLFA